jgi:hypothetical protein
MNHMVQLLTSSEKTCPWNPLSLTDNSRLYLDIHFMCALMEPWNCTLTSYYFSQEMQLYFQKCLIWQHTQIWYSFIMYFSSLLSCPSLYNSWLKGSCLEETKDQPGMEGVVRICERGEGEDWVGAEKMRPKDGIFGVASGLWESERLRQWGIETEDR